MIKNLRTTDIFVILDAIPALTALVDIFSEKPAEEYTPVDSYLYLSKVSDTTSTGTDSSIQGGTLIKQAIVTLNIVCGLNSAKSDTDELFDIVDAVNTEIVDEGQNKINNWNGIRMRKVTELSPAPIGYNTKNRAVLIKQYLFTYYAK